jgi:hypothetical protein
VRHLLPGPWSFGPSLNLLQRIRADEDRESLQHEGGGDWLTGTDETPIILILYFGGGYHGQRI